MKCRCNFSSRCIGIDVINLTHTVNSDSCNNGYITFLKHLFNRFRIDFCYIAHKEHIKLELVDDRTADVVNGIAFGQSSQARYIKSKQAFDICYTVEENTHKRGEVQLLIESIRPNTHEE